MSEEKILDNLGHVRAMLAKHKLVEELVHRQDMPRHDLVEGVLHVRVLQASMHYELDRTLRQEIVAKLKRRFGRVVRDVRFRVG